MRRRHFFQILKLATPFLFQGWDKENKRGKEGLFRGRGYRYPRAVVPGMRFRVRRDRYSGRD